MKFVVALTLALAVVTGAGAQSNPEQQQSSSESLNRSEELTKEYLDSFKKSGVPTSQGVVAAFESAKQAGTIEAWNEAAAISNAYANVVHVLSDNYQSRFHAERTLANQYSSSSRLDRARKLGEQALNYETVRNRYLSQRNEAYLEMAKLYLANGDKEMALSFAMTSVRLSGDSSNDVGEALILQIIELEKP